MSEQRAELVKKVTDAIRHAPVVRCGADGFCADWPACEHQMAVCADVALGVVEAAGWGPRAEPTTHVVLDRERWERVRTCRALKHLTPEALVTMQGLHPGDLDPE